MTRVVDAAAPTRRYAVLQAGARMHYAVPALLARAGLLGAFYTDLHASHRPLEALAVVLPNALRQGSLRRLLARQLPADLPRSLVRDQPMVSLSWARGARDETLLLELTCSESFGGANALNTNPP